MKGVVRMVVTHDTMCVALYEWMKARAINNFTVAMPTRVTQSRDGSRSFIVEFPNGAKVEPKESAP